MDKAHHIAIFLPSLRGGGAERVMVTLANGLAARGHRVDLVLTKAEGPYLAEVADRVRVVDLGRSRVLASLLPLVRYLRDEQPHAMLSALNHANIVAILARGVARANTRLVVSERNSLSGLRKHKGGVFFLLLIRFFYPRADGIVTVSQGIASELIEQLLVPEKLVKAIPNPVDLDMICVKAEERPDHPWLTPGEPPVILAVGRLSPQKDYPTLIEAFAKLRGKREVRLIILGDGDLRVELEQRIAALEIADCVQLPGFQTNPFGWMAACQVYVMSSQHEGFPNSLVQAMACGARIVSTDCPTGPDEILEGGKWGRLVPVGDTAALAEAMAKALDDPHSPDVCARAESFRSDPIIAEYAQMLS